MFLPMAIFRGITHTAMLSFLGLLSLLLLISSPSIALSFSSFKELRLPPGASGPESFAFDASSEGPYIGVADGRIIKYQGPKVGFKDFAYSFPRSLKAQCFGSNGNVNQTSGRRCGRPLGLAFYNPTGELYIADAYRGLLVAGTTAGKRARAVAVGVNGVRFLFTDDLDIDQEAGVVYFTDASTKFDLSQAIKAIDPHDSTGRLLKYEIKTKEVTILVEKLTLPVGAAVSRDGTFVLVSEFSANRIRKYWVRGPKAKTAEILLNLTGSPDNIQRSPSGDFWVAVNVNRSSTAETNVPTAIKINGFGKILASVDLRKQYNRTAISEVHEQLGKYYVGVANNFYFAGVYGK